MPDLGECSVTNRTLTGTRVSTHATTVMSVQSARRLAELVQARMRDLELSQSSLAAAGGPSTATVRGLINAAAAGQKFKDLQLQTLAKFDRGLQWEQGSARDVIAGGDPRPLSGTGPLHVISDGQSFLIPPPELAEALKAMSPAERAEAEARMWAEAFKAIREMRSA